MDNKSINDIETLSQKFIVKIISKEDYTYLIAENGDIYSFGNNEFCQHCSKDIKLISSPILNDFFKFTFSMTYPISILGKSPDIFFSFHEKIINI